MNLVTVGRAAQNELGRFRTLPWWRWWGRDEGTKSTPAPKPGAKSSPRLVVAVENGWHSEPQDVPLFVQRFVMAVTDQEDKDMIPTVEWWELYTDSEDNTHSEAFQQLLTGDAPSWNVDPAFQNVLITTRASKGQQQAQESIAFFRVTGQGTRYFVGHVPGTHAWLWGCCLWAMEQEEPADSGSRQ
jgi:hypothetical protein